MNLTEVLLRQEPLLIQPALLAAFAERCLRFNGSIEELLGARPMPQVIDGVGVIPVWGIIGRGLAPIEKACGASDTEELASWVEGMAANPAVRAILLDIDSPGGTITGVPELAEMIGALEKPTAAFTSSLAASAAYWIGSRADSFFTTPSASLGSVGVFLPFLDASAAFAQAGLSMEVIRSGQFKGMGLLGTSLTEEQRTHLQERVAQGHEMFKAAVREKRRYVRDSSMQGQVFYGADAVEKNIATSLVRNRADALRRLTAAS